MWPVPSENGTLAIYTPGVLGEFTAVSDTVTFPPGYREMFEYNLALRIHDGYPEAIMLPGVEERARKSMALVKTKNIRPSRLRVDDATLQGLKAHQRSVYGYRSWFGE